MSPANIITQAKKENLNIIGITDHNTTKHCTLTQRLGAENGIFVLGGAEVTTKEEVHCLTFFDKTESLEEFQEYLEEHLPFVQNNPSFFGHQVVVNEKEEILEEVDSLLIVAINQSIEQVREKVNNLKGLFIPAHVNRPRNGILSQLGFLPDGLTPDAIEIYHRDSPETFLVSHPEFNKYVLLSNSDAHVPERIGRNYSSFFIDHLSFDEIRMALRRELGRKVLI